MLINLNWKTYVAVALALSAIFTVLATTDWATFLSNPKAALIPIGAVILNALITSEKKQVLTDLSKK